MERTAAVAEPKIVLERKRHGPPQGIDIVGRVFVHALRRLGARSVGEADEQDETHGQAEGPWLPWRNWRAHVRPPPGASEACVQRRARGRAHRHAAAGSTAATCVI